MAMNMGHQTLIIELMAMNMGHHTIIYYRPDDNEYGTLVLKQWHCTHKCHTRHVDNFTNTLH